MQLEDTDDDASTDDTANNKYNPYSLSLTQMVERDEEAAQPTPEQKRVIALMRDMRTKLEKFVQEECTRLRLPHGKNLHKNIERLSGTVDVTFLQAMHKLRDFGNAAVHSRLDTLPSREECSNAVQCYLQCKQRHKERLNFNRR